MAVNHNGDWGGRGGKFGVYGQSRSERSMQNQWKSDSHDWNNRVRSSYRRTRTQIGRSNLRQQNKDKEINRNIYALVSPPRSAPVRKNKKFNITSPILIRPRSHTSHGKRKTSHKRLSVPCISGDPQADAREACRLQPPESPRGRKVKHPLDCDHPLFSPPSKQDLRFFETLTSPPPREKMIVRDKEDHVRGIIRSESAPCLASKNRFLTTNASVFELRSPSKRQEIMSPGKRERILNNQNRINNYVKEKKAKTLLQDAKNVESKRALRETYQKKVDKLEAYHYKQEKRKEHMWGLS